LDNNKYFFPCHALSWTLQQRFLKEAQNSVKKNAYFMRKAMVSLVGVGGVGGHILLIGHSIKQVTWLCRMKTI